MQEIKKVSEARLDPNMSRSGMLTMTPKLAKSLGIDAQLAELPAEAEAVTIEYEHGKNDWLLEKAAPELAPTDDGDEEQPVAKFATSYEEGVAAIFKKTHDRVLETRKALEACITKRASVLKISEHAATKLMSDTNDAEFVELYEDVHKAEKFAMELPVTAAVAVVQAEIDPLEADIAKREEAFGIANNLPPDVAAERLATISKSHAAAKAKLHELYNDRGNAAAAAEMEVQHRLAHVTMLEKTAAPQASVYVSPALQALNSHIAKAAVARNISVEKATTELIDEGDPQTLNLYTLYSNERGAKGR